MNNPRVNSKNTEFGLFPKERFPNVSLSHNATKNNLSKPPAKDRRTIHERIDKGKSGQRVQEEWSESGQ